MSHVEPTTSVSVAMFNLEGGTMLGSDAKSPDRARQTWLQVSSLLAALCLTWPFLAFYSGAIGDVHSQVKEFDVGSTALILGGLSLIGVVDLCGIFVLFSRSFVKGLLSLVLPGYWFFALRREGLWLPFVGFTLAGFGVYALGAFIAT